MASRRNSSTRRSSGGRSSSRSSGRSSSGRSSSRSSSSSNGMLPVMLILGATVVIIAIVVASNSGGGEDTGNVQQPVQPTVQPKAAPSSLAKGSAAAGKTPDRPAPPLTMETLNQVNAMLAEAKELNREGVKLRTAGNNMEARDVQSKAAAKISELKRLIDAPLTWQEEAEMDDWAQPAEYVTLGKMFAKISSLEKMVRMGGGTR